MDKNRKNLFLYIAKCITACLLVFLLSWIFHYADITWCIISAMLVLTPESKEAIPLAITRIKANLIGGFGSLICLLFFPSNAITISIVIAFSILVCYYFNLMTGSRAAIAAVIIIMMHGMEFGQPHFWTVTIERIVSVIAGCALGLLITVVYHKEFFRKAEGSKSEEG